MEYVFWGAVVYFLYRFLFSNGYSKWAKSYKYATDKKHEAFIHSCRLEDKGELGSQQHSAWYREFKVWSEEVEKLENAEPKHFKKFVKNRIKSGGV